MRNALPAKTKVILLAIMVGLIGLVYLGLFYVISVLSRSSFGTNQRTVHLAWAQWKPGNQMLTFVGNTDSFITAEEEQELKNLNLAGAVEVFRTSIRGNGPEVRVIVLMYRQLDKPVELLPIPNQGRVIYIQQENGWEVYPPDTATLENSIELYIPDFDPNGTFYRIHVSGGTSGGGVFNWSPEFE